jgi:hypothetical protein
MTSNPRNPRVPPDWIVAVLLRVYPRAWRLEYGDELADILLARPLSPRVIADVLWNGLRVLMHAPEPSTILGLVSIPVVLAGFLSGVSYGRTWKLFPTDGSPFLAAGVFALLQVISGCWTHLRHRDRFYQSGLAAMRTALITGIPFVFVALIMLLGGVDLRVSGTTFPPSASMLLIAPLARLPDAWLWGSLGGLLGRRIVSLRQMAGAIQP